MKGYNRKMSLKRGGQSWLLWNKTIQLRPGRWQEWARHGGTVFLAGGQCVGGSRQEGTWSFRDLKEDLWGWRPVTEEDRDRRVSWGGGDGVGGDGGQHVQNLIIPSRPRAFLNKQWVPQAKDVFKQRRDTVMFTRSLWPLSEEWAGVGGGKRGTEATLHTCTPFHLSALSFCHLFFFFESLRQTLLMLPNQILVPDLEAAGHSKCWRRNSHQDKREKCCLLPCSCRKAGASLHLKLSLQMRFLTRSSLRRLDFGHGCSAL